jgi:2',3'-cyclic-nucleotide 2'-phosphodiesterase (5'-nucleotidase family)
VEDNDGCQFTRLDEILATLSVLALVLAIVPAAAEKPASVTVQILAVNDFHGALDPSLTNPTRPTSRCGITAAAPST